MDNAETENTSQAPPDKNQQTFYHLEIAEVRSGTQDVVIINSPVVRGVACWNYQVKVYVYRGPSKTKLLEIHPQIIQSRINYSKVKSTDDLFKAAAQSNCP